MRLEGIVIEGWKEGREIGFPTANILIKDNIVPGIWSGFVEVSGKKYKSAIYIGEKQKNILEAHIVDFSGDIYGEKIIVDLVEKIRDDIDIEDFEELKETIEKDVKNIKEKLCLLE